MQPKRWYERWHVWLLVLAVLAGGFLAEPKVRSRFNRWAEMRKIDRAAASFKKGDYAKAILDARGALESNPANLEANRIIAKSLEALDFPAALTWRIRLEGLLPNDPENSMALAKDALDVGDRERAARAIKNLKPQDQNTAVFHDVSARLAMSRRDVVSAEADWEQACQLEPKDDRYRLSLATLRLTSKKPGARAAAIEILREIARGSKHAVHALRTLLADAMLQTESARLNEFALSLGGGAATTVGQSADLYTLRELYLDRARAESADVREFADALVAAPGSTFDDKISRLSALREMKDPEASSYLEELRNAAVSNPDHIWRLVTWMNNNTLALLASDWVATLPADIVSKPPVCVAVADTYTKIPDWSKLRQAVEKGSWQEFDYMRRAFFARSLERLGEPDQGAAVWK